MKECHVCSFMCEDNALLCPICGAELLSEENISENNAYQAVTFKEIKKPVLAASVDSPVTAEIFKDILSENNIAYSSNEQGDFMHSGFGGSYFAIDIYVDEENLETAKELYKNLSENNFDFEDFEGFEDSEE